MSEPNPSGLPTLVTKRDGRLVPFEADKISQSLYDATLDQGQPNAFLVRELTDGILHFLSQEFAGVNPSTAQVAELTAKVVRELGQPALAQAYAEKQQRNHQTTPSTLLREKSARQAVEFRFNAKDAPGDVVRSCLRTYSLQAVFSRDLAAAHDEGLIVLGGLTHPDELASVVLEGGGPQSSMPGKGLAGWFPNTPGRTLVLDSPDCGLTPDQAGPCLSGLLDACMALEKGALLNLHVALPPPWVQAGGTGPLFGSMHPALPSGKSHQVLDHLLETWVKLDARERLRLDWHLSESDFAEDNADRLLTLVRLGKEHGHLRFTLDRPRRTVHLAEGLGRGQPAVLLEVGLHLPPLLARPGVDGDAQKFLQKLPSLARMGVRAGIQKRNFLRAQGKPALARGFLLDRARLLIVPLGLDYLVQSLLGQGMAQGKLPLDLARQIIESLKNTLHQESRAANLDIAIDSPTRPSDWVQPHPAAAPGLVPAISSEVGQKEIHAAGILHGLAGFGTLPLHSKSTPEELVQLLKYAWNKTDVVRFAP